MRHEYKMAMAWGVGAFAAMVHSIGRLLGWWAYTGWLFWLIIAWLLLLVGYEFVLLARLKRDERGAEE